MSEMVTELRRRPITVAEYHRMAEVGILSEGERVELLRGDIVAKPVIGDAHRGCVNRLNRMLRCFEDRAYIQVQNPVVVLEDSEPEPDIALLEINEAAVGGRHALPADVIAIVEVADSSRHLDLQLKVPMYVEAGIRECWIVDLVDRVVRVHRDPSPAGYRLALIARAGESIAFAAFPDELLAVEEILGVRAT